MEKEIIKNNSWSKPFNYTSWLQPILHYSQNKVAQYGANYMAFAFFMTLNYTVPFFMHTHAGSESYKWVLLIKTIGTLLCVGLFLEPYWPTGLKKYFAIYWHFSLLYCLPFSFTFLFLINGNNVEWLINIALAITLLIVLADWRTFMLTLILGTTLALWTYHQFVGKLPFLDLENWYTIIYACIFAMLVGLIFARRKEIDFDFLMMRNQYLTDNQKKTQQELVQALNAREELIKELNPDEIARFDQATAAYIKQAVYRIKNYLRLSVSQFAIDELLQAVQNDFQLSRAHSGHTLIMHQYTKQQTIEGDLQKLKQLIVNSLTYLIQNTADNQPIWLSIEDTSLGHGIAHMKHYTRKIAAIRLTISLNNALPELASLYSIQPSNIDIDETMHQTTELPLLENSRIIEAHYGYANTEAADTHCYVIPVQLRELRGKVMELLREPAAADPAELSHPVAIEREKQLMDKLKNTSIDLTQITKALELIKKYHGGVKRKSGEPFFTHPIAVALIVLDYSQDQDAVLASLLHDTVEDTSLSMAHIKLMFGETVAFLVGKATNLEDDLRRISLQDHENLYRLVNYEDERAALVKLADRLHNMRTIQGHPSLSKQKRIAQETLTFFVPLAKQLQLPTMADELEKIGLDIMSQ